MVVDSPPGTTSASSPARCAGRETRTGVTPSAASAAPCRAKSPCTLSTPTRGGIRSAHQPRFASCSSAGTDSAATPFMARGNPSEIRASSSGLS